MKPDLTSLSHAASCKRLVRALAALALITLSLPVMARVAPTADLTELSLDELLNMEVSSASKFPQKLSQAPAAVSIITALDIKDQGYHTLADILRGVRGLYVSNDRNYSYLGARGMNRPGDYNDRFLVMVDGFRINDAVYESANIGNEFPLAIDMIERVEVVRGAGSSIYGSNAFFGVINILTKRGRDAGGAKLKVGAGSFGSTLGAVSYGELRDDGVEFLVSAQSEDSKGQNLYFPEFNTPANNNGVALGADKGNAKRVFAKLAYDKIALTSFYSERLKAVPTAAFGSVFNDPRLQTTDNYAGLALSYDTPLAEHHALTSRLAYNSYSYYGTYPWNQPPVTLNMDSVHGKWWAADSKLVSDLGEHKLVTGWEYQNNFQQDQKNYDLAPYFLYLDDKRSSNRHAFYAQDEMTVSDTFRVNGGVRYDHYSLTGNVVNPRLALIYSPLPDTTIKALYGKAFRAPNQYEMFYVATTQKANPNLKPERITTKELVLEQQLQTNLRLTGSLYYNSISSMIDQVLDPADGLLVFRNITQTRSKGSEVELERAWENDTRLRASYAWQISRDHATGMELVNSPRHLAKLNYSLPVWDTALRAGTEAQYNSGRKTLAGSSAGGYSVFNFTLRSAKVITGMELSASIYNLLNRRYADPARPEHVQTLIPQDGRSFFLQLSYQL